MGAAITDWGTAIVTSLVVLLSPLAWPSDLVDSKLLISTWNGQSKV